MCVRVGVANFFFCSTRAIHFRYHFFSFKAVRATFLGRLWALVLERHSPVTEMYWSCQYLSTDYDSHIGTLLSSFYSFRDLCVHMVGRTHG